MHTLVKQFNAPTIALLLLGAWFPASADDTEIYVGLSTSQSEAKPNVLFIMDTSGSMGTEVTITNVYDPTTTYTGSCSADHIFWKTSSQSIPECDSDRYFHAADFRCDAAQDPLFNATTGVGFYQDTIARWRPRSRNRSRWRSLSTNVKNPPHVECEADWGIHGVDDTSGAVYVANRSNGPYTANIDDATTWSNINTNFYTLYSANYLNWYNSTLSTTITTRIEIVKDVLKNLIDANSGLNIGLMRFDTASSSTGGLYNGNLGGPVIYPMADMDTGTVAADFKAEVDTLTDQGWTPLSETFYEALLYYRGGVPKYGLLSGNDLTSTPTSMTSTAGVTRYISPIKFQCQKNFIVYLTDGTPTYDWNADTEINALFPGTGGLTLGACAHGNGQNSGSNNCLDHLAEYMYISDHATTALGNPLSGTQNIATYTVGFNTNQALLSSAANNGGGKYYTAENSQDLGEAFTNIIAEIQAVNTTFTAPAVSVNAFNRITHRKELYFTIFKPGDTPHWDGNVKRFKLDFLLDGNGDPLDADNDGVPDPPEILDFNNDLAVDPATGFFKVNSTSWWTPTSDAPDGDETTKGGAASVLPEVPSTRKVYTYTGTELDLTAASNNLHEDNAQTAAQPLGKITKTMLNDSGMSDTDMTNLLMWSRGVDVSDDDEDGLTTDGRKILGDSLHAKPRLISYGGTEANPDITLFAITNDGYFHAIKTADGTEYFTFVPQEELKKLNTLYLDVATGGLSHNYGLDGDIEVWTNDVDKDGVIEPADGDHVYVYFGQRRGGTYYYALDVTDRSTPKLLWSIQGGIGGTSGFEELADTWSSPDHKRVKVQVSGSLVAKDILIFGGGYDIGQDLADTAQTVDASGRAIYIVDALTGTLLWWAANSTLTSPAPDLPLDDMEFSIPSKIRVIDVDQDSFVDRMYVGDMGGQVWRFDIDNTTNSSLSSRITGGLVAKLQQQSATSTPGLADNRRFYYAPDIALVREPGNPDFLAISIGSGYRSHPLNLGVEDRFYMIRDFNVDGPPLSGSPASIDYGTPITEADLFDATTVINFTDNQRDDLLNQKQGWLLKLNDVDTGAYKGEKVLAAPLIVAGMILFTTSTPVDAESSSVCAPSQGLGRLYSVNLTDATPVQNLDLIGGAALTREDRSLNLVHSGLPPEVTVVFTEYQPVALVGAERLDLELNINLSTTYWYQD